MMKKNKTLTISVISTIIITVIFICSYSSNENKDYKIIITKFFKEVIRGREADSVIFKNYFYQNDPRMKYGRSKAAQDYYIDTVFPFIRNKYSSTDFEIEVLKIEETAGDSLVEYGVYNESNQGNVYIAKLKTNVEVKVLYILAVNYKDVNKSVGCECYNKNQIVSIIPEKFLDNQIILWK